MNRVTIVVDVLNADPRHGGLFATAPERAEGPAAEDRRSGRERRDPVPHLVAATLPGEARQYCFRSFGDRRVKHKGRMPAASAACNIAQPPTDEPPPFAASGYASSTSWEREEILVRIDEGGGDGSSLRWLHIRT
ncbi:MAG: hypothetical protein IPK78_02910 [Rhodospirillales bacterium]|nr:hypothetical protein [Rhodospirillales bacterium]